MESYKKLINEVKKHEILYERSHEEYNNEEKKNRVWDDIGLSTNMTGERAKKKWENIHNAYKSSKSSSGESANKFANLLSFLEAEGNKTFSTFNESSASFLECPKDDQTSTPQSKKKKRKFNKSHTEEAELSQINAYDSPPVNIGATSLAMVGGQDDIDSFCNLVATRLRLLPESQLKKSKRRILEILHKSEIESLDLGKLGIEDKC